MIAARKQLKKMENALVRLVADVEYFRPGYRQHVRALNCSIRGKNMQIPPQFPYCLHFPPKLPNLKPRIFLFCFSALCPKRDTFHSALFQHAPILCHHSSLLHPAL